MYTARHMTIEIC